MLTGRPHQPFPVWLVSPPEFPAERLALAKTDSSARGTSHGSSPYPSVSGGRQLYRLLTRSENPIIYCEKIILAGKFI
jgi:hypothetical protein